jgi:hypothetical protein
MNPYAAKNLTLTKKMKLATPTDIKENIYGLKFVAESIYKK